MKRLFLCAMLVVSSSKASQELLCLFEKISKTEDYAEWDEKVEKISVIEYPHKLEFKTETKDDEWHELKRTQENGKESITVDHKKKSGGLEALLEGGALSIPVLPKEEARLRATCSNFLKFKAAGYNNTPSKL